MWRKFRILMILLRTHRRDSPVRVFDLCRIAISALVATAAFAACAGSMPNQTPEGGQNSVILGMPRSWMSPDAKKAKKLLYVSDGATRSVYVYNYKTRAMVGQLTGFAIPEGQCVDKKGDVWITDANGGAPVVEYAHGGTNPIKSLPTRGYAFGCSVSPDGDLAVSNTYSSNQYKIGDIEVWRHASGAPTSFKNTECPTPGPPGYDDNGTLYVESSPPFGPHANVCELRKGGKKLTFISVSQQIGGPGGVQWDGKELTLTDTAYDGTSTTAIYQAWGPPSELEIIGTTALSDPCDGGYTSVDQPFIVGATNTPVSHEEGTVVVGSNGLCKSRVDFWSYPAGGNPIATLSPAPAQPEGQSVSISE